MSDATKDETKDQTGTPTEPTPPVDEGKPLFGIKPIKALFAAEYVLQGLANPFQGITYQPFLTHFRQTYGLTEAAAQNYFSQSYLAWSFKPILGFLVDAFGRTRTLLVVLLGVATIFFAVTPALDSGPGVFFWLMFTLSVVLATTDVVVDRATVVEGDAESKESGKSKAATVGLNQTICWLAIYGTSIFASISGGYVAEHFHINTLLFLLALVPAMVLVIAWRLPKDTAPLIPLGQSIRNFWDGLNTGPVLWIVVFYFLFHFQPQGGAIWNNYLQETLSFSQTAIGFSDGASYVGYFLGTLAFAKWGIRWQDQYGLKKLFFYFIPISALFSLTQMFLLDPYFTTITDGIASVVPLPKEQVRLGFLSSYSFILYMVNGFIRMSTFSLVGAVIPAAAAGSLFAGFMSVANLGYSFSYSTGAWLYSDGLKYPAIASLHSALGLQPSKDGELSMAGLVLIGSGAYFLSFLATSRLPNRAETASTEDASAALVGPEHFKALGPSILNQTNLATGVLVVAAFVGLWQGLEQAPIASALLAFFGMAFLRKVYLDWLFSRMSPR